MEEKGERLAQIRGKIAIRMEFSSIREIIRTKLNQSVTNEQILEAAQIVSKKMTGENFNANTQKELLNGLIFYRRFLESAIRKREEKAKVT